MKTHWQVETDSQGILWLGLDYAGGAANVLATEVLRELEQRLDEIEAAPPKALVLHSLKRGFIAGADLNEIEGVTDPGDAVAVQIGPGLVDRRADRRQMVEQRFPHAPLLNAVVGRRRL